MNEGKIMKLIEFKKLLEQLPNEVEVKVLWDNNYNNELSIKFDIDNYDKYRNLYCMTEWYYPFSKLFNDKYEEMKKEEEKRKIIEEYEKNKKGGIE